MVEAVWASDEDSQWVKAIAEQTREDHDEDHPRHEMWSSLADLLDVLVIKYNSILDTGRPGSKAMRAAARSQVIGWLEAMAMCRAYEEAKESLDG